MSGGTVDIVVHQIGANSVLQELHPACGNNSGGDTVNAAFLQFLQDKCGESVVDKLKTSEKYDFFTLMSNFETKKRHFSTQSDQYKAIIRLPQILLQELTRKNRESSLEQQIQNIELSSSIYLTKPDAREFDLIGDKLKLGWSEMFSFFEESTTSIKLCLENLLANHLVNSVQYILMVGGYSESVALQDFIKKSFSSKTVIVPSDAGLAVLKGAVLYGHDPSVIGERRCRLTYGIACKMIYDSSIHKESTKYIDDEGTHRVFNGFDIHVKVGQNIKTGLFQPERSYLPANLQAKTATYSLYACPRPNPVYVTEPDCVKIGEMEVDRSDLKGTKNEREILLALCFSGTEITIRTTKKQTGEVLSAKIKYDR